MGQQLLHPLHFISGKQAGVDLVQPKGPPHRLAHGRGVAGEHHRAAHALRLQHLKGAGSALLNLVGHHQAAQVLPICRHIDHGASRFPVLRHRHVKFLHQLPVACQHGPAVHHGPDAPSGELLRLGNPAEVRLRAGLLDGPGDGVGAEMLRQRGQFQKLLPAAQGSLRLSHSKAPLGQGTRLVKDHNAGLGQGLQVVAALHQDALAGGPTNAPEEAEGDGDDQGAGAGNHQEDESPLNPHTEGAQPQQRRQEPQGQGGKDYRRGIVAGKLGDEVLRLGLFGCGVLHQLQNFGHGGVLKGLGDPDAQHPGEIDAAADHVPALPHLTGHGLAGEGGGIQGGAALRHHAVQGDALTGLDQNGVSHGDLLRVHLHQLALPLHIGIVGADVHKVGDGAAAAVHRHALEELPYLVEEHDRHALPVLAAAEGAHGGHRHEEVFVKDLAVFDVADGPPQHIPADDEIRNEIGHPLRQGEGGLARLAHMAHRHKGDPHGQPDVPAPQGQPQQQGEAQQNPAQHLFLLFGHDTPLLRSGARPRGGQRLISAQSRSPAPPFCRPSPPGA